VDIEFDNEDYAKKNIHISYIQDLNQLNCHEMTSLLEFNYFSCCIVLTQLFYNK